MPVITISNQFGAGGPELGRALAKRLGLDYLDKEIIHKVALEINVPHSHVEEFEAERHDKFRNFFSGIFDLDALKHKANVAHAAEAAESKYDDREKIPFQFNVDGWIDSDIYKQMIIKVIMETAKRGNVVIAGRGGQHILSNFENAIHLRLVANMTDRIDRVVKQRGIKQSDAEDYVSTLDSRSRDYLRFYFNVDPDLPTLYHLMMNTSRVSLDKCENLVASLA